MCFWSFSLLFLVSAKCLGLSVVSDQESTAAVAAWQGGKAWFVSVSPKIRLIQSYDIRLSDSVPMFLPLTSPGDPKVFHCCHFTVILLSCDCGKQPNSFFSIKKKAHSELGSYLWITLSVIFLDHSLPAYIEYVFYSEFIQVLNRLLKSSHDCQNAERPFSHAHASCVCVSAYPSTPRAATGRK